MRRRTVMLHVPALPVLPAYPDYFLGTVDAAFDTQLV